MAWQFGKHEELPRPIERLILVVQPSLEDLEHARRVRYARMKERRAEVAEALAQQERERRRETVRQNQENNIRRRREQFARILAYLRTCEQGMTVEQIADACDVSCREVRQVVTTAKRQRWLVEDANRTHALIRIGKVTP